MKKVFISQPIEGKTIEEIKELRKKTSQYLESKGYQVLNKIFADELEINNSSNLSILRIIGKNIYKMSECDAVFFAEGWAVSRECRIDRLTAVLYHIEILEDEIIK